MATKVVTVDIQAEIDGKPIHVHSAQLALGVNAIPRITLSVAPAKHFNASPLRPSVITPEISYFTEIFERLYNKANSLNSKGTVKIKVHQPGMGGDIDRKLRGAGQATRSRKLSPGTKTREDSIVLKDWVLSGVGLSGLSPMSAPYLSVVLEHPICNLTKVGDIYETFRINSMLGLAMATSQGRSLLQIMNSVYDWVRNGDNLFYQASDVAKLFRKRLGANQFDPALYLEEKPAGPMFLESALRGISNVGLTTAIGRMALPTYENCPSIWDTLIRMCGALMLTIVQDQTNNFLGPKLVIEPLKPWKKCSIHLNEEECFGTLIPGQDPFKIVGAMVRKPNTWNGKISLGLSKTGAGDQDDDMSSILYVPDGVTPQLADGRIVKTSCPAILAQALMDDAAYGPRISNGLSALTSARMAGLQAPLRKFCQAVYETMVESMRIGRADMALAFRDRDGMLILPGNTCGMFSADKESIYYAYINEVVHYMSSDGECRTSLSMSRMRPNEILKVDGIPVIEDGNINAAYNA